MVSARIDGAVPNQHSVCQSHGQTSRGDTERLSDGASCRGVELTQGRGWSAGSGAELAAAVGPGLIQNLTDWQRLLLGDAGDF